MGQTKRDSWKIKYLNCDFAGFLLWTSASSLREVTEQWTSHSRQQWNTNEIIKNCLYLLYSYIIQTQWKQYFCKNCKTLRKPNCSLWFTVSKHTALKGQFTPKTIMYTFFPLTCGAIYPTGLFWHESQSFGDICSRDVCALSSIMELDSICLAVLKVP